VNWLRLPFQKLLTVVARPLGLNSSMGMFCWDCGRFATRWDCLWWAENDVWDKIIMSEHRHGIYCPLCFEKRAHERKISLRWKQVIE
jgi:hypothetical protein